MGTILLAVTAVILVGCTLLGYYRGLLKSVFGLFSLLLSLILMIVLQPAVNEVLRTSTPIHTSVQSVVKDFLEEELTEWLENTKASGESREAAESEAATEAGENTSGIVIPEVVLSPEQQEQLMELTHLPHILWGNAQDAIEMQAEVFLESVSERIADAVVNALSYLLTFVIVFVLIRVLYAVLGLMGKLPGIRGVNRMLGGLFGLMEGVILLWLLCQVITILLPINIGKDILTAINDNPILSELYEMLMSFGR